MYTHVRAYVSGGLTLGEAGNGAKLPARVLLYHCITVRLTVLLHDCITVLLYNYITILLVYHLTIQLYYYTTVLLYCYITILLHCYITISRPLHDEFGGLTI